METMEKTTNDTHGTAGKGWYGFDLDGTLARYDGWKGIDHIGEPIAKMIKIVCDMHHKGEVVKIMTARVAPRDNPETKPNPWFGNVPAYAEQYLECERPTPDVISAFYSMPAWTAKNFVADWCIKYLGFLPEITYQKDGMMITLYDDRVKQVVPNKGVLVEDLVPKPDPDWSEKCARCMEDGLNDDEECEYYGDPAGCNSPIYGQHPKTKSWNTSAIREGLEDILAAAEMMATDEMSQTRYKMNRSFIDGIILHAKKGLAKPARNCDVFVTREDCDDAYANYVRWHMEDRLARNDVTSSSLDWEDWLFSKYDPKFYRPFETAGAQSENTDQG